MATMKDDDVIVPVYNIAMICHGMPSWFDDKP